MRHRNIHFDLGHHGSVQHFLKSIGGTITHTADHTIDAVSHTYMAVAKETGSTIRALGNDVRSGVSSLSMPLILAGVVALVVMARR